MQDSLVVEEDVMVKFPLVSFITYPLPLKLLFQGFSYQEEVEQSYCKYTQDPTSRIFWCPETPDLLLRATLPCFSEQCNHCGKNFSKQLNSV